MTNTINKPFNERTDAEAEAPIFWPPDGNSRLLEKTLMLGMIEGKKRRGWQRMRLVRQHHQLSGHELGQTPGDGEEQGSLAHCSPWGHKSWTQRSD